MSDEDFDDYDDELTSMISVFNANQEAKTFPTNPISTSYSSSINLSSVCMKDIPVDLVLPNTTGKSTSVSKPNTLHPDLDDLEDLFDNLDQETLDSLIEQDSKTSAELKEFKPFTLESKSNPYGYKAFDGSYPKEHRIELTSSDLSQTSLKKSPTSPDQEYSTNLVKRIFQNNVPQSIECATKSSVNKNDKDSQSMYIPPSTYYELYRDHCPLDFCPDSIETWIYPTNYPVREYQFNIIQRALYENTLVSLPTGLGKTFIAAVVMFNFFKWFPKHKVIFTAPTKPLVSQQIEACYKICGITRTESIELTGEIGPDSRIDFWREKRVFYLTPQVLDNDLQSGLISPMDISCIVFDEAHRAQGSYAYVKVAECIHQRNPLVRILALSATPGRTIQTVQSVIDNLRIARIEARNEEAPDIKPYTFDKLVDKIVVPLSPNLEKTIETFTSLFMPELRSLYRKKFIWSFDINNVSSYKLIMNRESFHKQGITGWEAGVTEGEFALCISFLKKLELLTKYGHTTFVSKLREWRQESSSAISKYRKRMLNNPKFIELIKDLEKFVSEPDYNAKLNSHPKLSHLSSYLSSFFRSCSSDSKGNQIQSKVIIFANYRETVEEILAVISRLGSCVRPIAFVGQSNTKASKGLKQKEQIEVISKFKDGSYNVLISTSIGEEGLDIGEVDLIVCYDSQTSPIRMLQRFGRTGRRRQGRVLILLTQGSEEQNFDKAKESHETILNSLNSKSFSLFDENPRIIPEGIYPKCIKQNMIIPSYNSSAMPHPQSLGIQSLSGLSNKKVYQPSSESSHSDPFSKSLLSQQNQSKPISQVSHIQNTKSRVTTKGGAHFKKFNNPLLSIASLSTDTINSDSGTSNNTMQPKLFSKDTNNADHTLLGKSLDITPSTNSPLSASHEKTKIGFHNIDGRMNRIFAYHNEIAKRRKLLQTPAVTNSQIFNESNFNPNSHSEKDKTESERQDVNRLSNSKEFRDN